MLRHYAASLRFYNYGNSVDYLKGSVLGQCSGQAGTLMLFAGTRGALDRAPIIATWIFAGA